MLPEISAKNFPRNSWWAYLHSDGKKKVSNYIAGIVPIGPGRRYTLSIYSTTTLCIRRALPGRRSIKPLVLPSQPLSPEYADANQKTLETPWWSTMTK